MIKCYSKVFKFVSATILNQWIKLKLDIFCLICELVTIVMFGTDPLQIKSSYLFGNSLSEMNMFPID